MEEEKDKVIKIILQSDLKLTELAINDFILKCRAWLVPLGYLEVFKNNHPNESMFRVDFIKDNTRIRCTRSYDDEYCQISATLPYPTLC